MEDSTTLILVGLIALAFVGSHFLHRSAERWGLVSGIEYALVGVMIGPVSPFGDLVTDDMLQSLDLLISLLLGLLGFMVGLHARQALREFEHFLAGSMAAVIVAVVVGLSCLGLVQFIDPSYLSVEDPIVEYAVYADDASIYEVWAAEDALWLALTLGAAAAIASSTAIAATVKRWRAEGPPVDLLRNLAIAGQVVAIILFGVALSGDRAVDEASRFDWSLVEWSFWITVAGALTGLLFTVYIRNDEDDDLRLFLTTVGVVIFAAGIGAALGVSPLFVNLVAGLMVAATSVHRDRLRTKLQALVHPVSVLIMVFAGIAWRPISGWMWLIPLAYLLTRVAAQLFASRFAVSAFVHGVELRSVGGGLIGQGALAAAIALSYAQGHPERGPIVLSTVLVSMLVTDIIGGQTLRRVLANAGAIRPRAQLEDEDEAAEAEDAAHSGHGGHEPEHEAETAAPSEESGAAEPSTSEEDDHGH